MNRRAKSIERRAEIVRVTLDLLAETPLARLTTRQIADQLDISQPALFRHFRNKEQLLLAVIRGARLELNDVASEVLDQADQPLDRLQRLARQLLSHVEQHPGLARLLFSPCQKGPLRDALRQLVSMQRSMISQLIRDGQDQGVLRPNMDAAEAATYFVGMIQGIVLRAQLSDEPMQLADEVTPMLSLWLDGARSASAPCELGQPLVPVEAVPSPTVALRSLDVRPILASGGEPLDRILTALATVRATGVLTVTAPFLPKPLLRLLDERGHATVTREIGGGAWSVDIIAGGAPSIVELLDLEPPEPLERVLEAVSALAPGECYIARLPRRPNLLVPHLEERPVSFQFSESADGTALVRVEAAM